MLQAKRAPSKFSLMRSRAKLSVSVASGTLYALERGGRSTLGDFGWYREGGNSKGSSTTTNCTTLGQDRTLFTFVLIGAALRWRRRRRAPLKKANARSF